MATVLIIDDQLISRMILEELMRGMDGNIEAISFEDPVAALEWAKNHPVDLVLTDYKMPNMDGVEFTQWLRKIPSCSDIPVIIITCFDDKEVKYRALEAGATDFLGKPIDHHECRARCHNLLTLREQIAAQLSCYREVACDPDAEITVLPGATEGIFCAIMASISEAMAPTVSACSASCGSSALSRKWTGIQRYASGRASSNGLLAVRQGCQSDSRIRCTNMPNR